MAKSKLNQASIYRVSLLNNMERTGTNGTEELQRNTTGEHSKHPLLRDQMNYDIMKYHIRAKINDPDIY